MFKVESFIQGSGYKISSEAHISTLSGTVNKNIIDENKKMDHFYKKRTK